MINLKTSICWLQLHADGGSASAGASGTGSSVADAGQGQGQNNSQVAPGKATFDDLLKDADYKKAYDERVSKAIQNRFKSANLAEERLRNAEGLFDKLGSKYGIAREEDGTFDIDKLVKAADDDDSYYEAEALEKGVSVEELKKFKSLEKENAEFKRMISTAKQRAAETAFEQRIAEESAKVQALYPSFDFAVESQNEQFRRMVNAGVPLQAAYEVCHRDEFTSAVMKYGADRTAQKTAQTIAAGRARPTENGSSNASATDTRYDVKNLTKAQISEIIERVKRGEKIHF